MQKNREIMDDLNNEPDLDLETYAMVLAGIWATAIFFHEMERGGDVLELKRNIWLTAEELAKDMGMLMCTWNKNIEAVQNATTN